MLRGEQKRGHLSTRSRAQASLNCQDSMKAKTCQAGADFELNLLIAKLTSFYKVVEVS